MIASIPSATLNGVDGHSVTVEVHVSNGLPGCAIVGLPDMACREARDRVRAALLSSGVKWPSTRLTINLAPSGLRKTGTGFEVAIAVGLLVACELVPPESIKGLGFIGEVGLDGTIRPIDGVVPLVDAIHTPVVVVPEQSTQQALLVGRHDVRGVSTIADLIEMLRGNLPWMTATPVIGRGSVNTATEPDIADVRGQPVAKWAVEVAAAGGHNLLFTGPPGAGKTMLARRLPALLPDLDAETSLTATRIHSVAGLLREDADLVTRPPFRSPHHTSSQASITGGGSGRIKPGEATIAHGGVLFLDEMTEFPRAVLDVLRQPLEEHVLHVSRADTKVSMPARFQLIGATNPCPCGEGMTPGSCRCSYAVRSRYLARLSGPLLDRFDLRVPVHRADPEKFFEIRTGEPSHVVAQRVAESRERAQARGYRCNAELRSSDLDEWAPLGKDATALLAQKMRKGTLTARGLDRIRRVALTLADLDGGSSVLKDHHICAALELRPELFSFAEAS